MRRLFPFVIALALLPAALHAQTAAQSGPASAYPDPTLTPGAVFADVAADQVCVSGYSRGVRNVTSAERQAVWDEYGLVADSALYEVDHFIPLELGGSNDITNLWPEPYDPYPGAHEKDAVENYLHDLVCAGSMSLEDAQTAIATDWYAVFQTIAVPVTRPSAPLAPSAPAPAPAAAASHTWYTSSASNATTYYCDDDPEWRTLSPRNLRQYPSVAALKADYPTKHLHRACLDGATGP
jgi:hypothetical protein